VKQRHRTTTTTTTKTTATNQQAPTQQTTKVNHGQGITEKQVPIKTTHKNQKFPKKEKLQKNQKITNRIFFFPPLPPLSTSFHLFPLT